MFRLRRYFGSVAIGVALVAGLPASAQGQFRTAAEAEIDAAIQQNREAIQLMREGHYDAAITLAEKALRRLERTRVGDDPNVASVLTNLGVMHKKKGSLAKAEQLYLQSLAIREKIFGPEHEDVAHSLHNLTTLYEEKGDYARAEPLYQRALKIREKTLGATHPSVGTTLNNLARLYQEKGDLSRAEPLFLRALAIMEATVGPEHPDVSRPLSNLGALYRNMNKYEQADAHYQRALRIREKALGPNHPALSPNKPPILHLTRLRRPASILRICALARIQAQS